MQQGLVLPSAQPDGAGMSGLVTCQIPDGTDSHPAAVHDVSPAARIRAAAQSSARPPPRFQSFTMSAHGTRGVRVTQQRGAGEFKDTDLSG